MGGSLDSNSKTLKDVQTINMSSQLHTAALDTRIADYKLLRIFTPELKRRIQLHHLHSPYVVEYKQQVFLSLEHIVDAQKRAFYYRQIQCYQMDQEVDLAILPIELQQILHPDLMPPPLFWGPLIVGAIVGLIVGVLAMAIGMLFVNATAVPFGNSTDTINLQIPIITFVFSAAIGWIVTSMIVWRRWKHAH